VLIQYRSVTATQPPSHVAVAITLNALAKASSLKTDPCHLYKDEKYVPKVAVSGGQFFYLRDLVSAVIATATCLAGWLAGWLSHSGIVSKRLNLSENFFDHLKAPSFYLLETPAPIQIPWESVQRGR